MEYPHWYTAIFISRASKQRRKGAAMALFSAVLLLLATLFFPTYTVDYFISSLEINLYSLLSGVSELAYYTGINTNNIPEWTSLLLVALPLIQIVMAAFTLNVFCVVAPLVTVLGESLLYLHICRMAPGSSNFFKLGNGFWVTLLALAIQIVAVVISIRSEKSLLLQNNTLQDQEYKDDDGREDATGLLSDPSDIQPPHIAAVLFRLNTNCSYGVPENNVVILGRDPSKVDIALDNPTVGRIHTKVTSINGKLLVEDLNSSNGTYLGDARLEPGIPAEAREGDYITVSNEIFQVRRP